MLPLPSEPLGDPKADSNYSRTIRERAKHHQRKENVGTAEPCFLMQSAIQLSRH